MVEENMTLPDNWEMKTVGEAIVCDFGDRITQSENRGTLYPVYGGGDKSFMTDSFNRSNEWVIGRFAISPTCVRFVKNDFWLMDSGLTFHTANDEIDQDYAGYYMYYIQPLIYNATTQTAQKNLDQVRFERLPFIVPPLPEQRRVAAVLSDLDDYIEKQERLIEKNKKFRDGMLEELMCAMRDSDELTLNELCSVITDGSHFSPTEVSDGYFMPSVKDMGDNGFVFDNCKQISKKDYDNLCRSGCQPKKGDVLIAKDGSMLRYVFHLNETFPIVVLSSIAICRPKPNMVDGKYLAQYFKLPTFVKKVIEENKTGTGVPRITLDKFKQIKIPVPSLDEQQRIASIMSNLDDNIAKQQEKLDKARKLKDALLNDLISGKIRLTDDEK